MPIVSLVQIHELTNSPLKFEAIETVEVFRSQIRRREGYQSRADWMATVTTSKICQMSARKSGQLARQETLRITAEVLRDDGSGADFRSGSPQRAGRCFGSTLALRAL